MRAVGPAGGRKDELFGVDESVPDEHDRAVEPRDDVSDAEPEPPSGLVQGGERDGIAELCGATTWGTVDCLDVVSGGR